MVLSLRGRTVQTPEAFSERCRLVLSLIPSAPEWLAWAIRDSNAHFAFADEEGLLGAVPDLHDSALILLPALGLQVCSAKLVTLEIDALKALVAAEQTGGEEALAKARAVLVEHGLLTQADLAAGPAFLATLGVGDAPVFQIMDYPAHVAVLALADVLSGVDAELAREAAAFALTVSSTPAEFADHVEIYVALAGEGEAPAARAARIAGVVRALKGKVFGYLSTLLINEAHIAGIVRQAISQLLTRGLFLGFTRLSLAVREVVAVGKPMALEDVDAAVRACIEPISGLLAGGLLRLREGKLRQDGAIEFPIEIGGRRLVILLTTGGTVSLDRARLAA